MKDRKIKVGIVDDNKSTINSLSEFINYSDKTKITVTALSGLSLIKKLKSLEEDDFPDVILTDVDMAEMNGIETVQHCKLLYPDLKFLMLTVFDDSNLLFNAIKAGASGYLLKDEKVEIIIQYIEQLIYKGGAPMSPSIARKTLDMLAAPRNFEKKDEPIVNEVYALSTREKEVLKLLVDGLDYKEIAHQLFLSPHTIRKHISNIYDKLHVTSKAQAIKLANLKNLY